MKFFRFVIFAFALALGIPTVANITSTVNRTGPYTCASLPATVPVVFPYQFSTDLLVLNLGQGGTSNDPPVVLTLNSDYTVTAGGYNATTNMLSGNVVVNSGGAHSVLAGDQVVVLRNVPVNQQTSFVSGILTAAVIEKAFDKQATISQQLTENMSRGLQFEAGETQSGILTRTARTSKLLGFDASGNLSFYTPGSGGGGGGGGTSYTAGAGLLLAANVFSVDPVQSLTTLTVSGTMTGTLTGNASSASILSPGRTINGVAFNGSMNVTVPAAAGTLTGTTLASNVIGSSLTSAAVGTFGTMAIQNANAVNVTGGTIDGAAVTGLSAPTNASDAATKDYVDHFSSGITPRTGVVAATTANITLSGPQTIDGQAVIAGNRVLVKNQTAPAQNGIYDVAAGAWARSSDSNTAVELLFGYYYFVSSGTSNGSTAWFIQTPPAILGVDPVVFSQFSASTAYTAGTGLGLVGNQFSINSAQSGLAITGSSFNGTVGAVTPSTGIFTTATVDGTGSSPYFKVTNGTVSLDARMGSSFSSALFGVGTVSAHNVAIYRGNSQVGLFTATGMDNTIIGATTPAAITTNILTRTGTSTNNTVLGVVSDSTTYNLLTLNNVATLAGSMGISGGGGSDGSLYLRVPVGGTFDFRINNAAIGAVTATGLNSMPVGTTTPAAGAFTTLSATTPLPIASGGTAGATAAAARTNLGVTATGADTTYNFRANNLSDVASAATSRTNLGVTATGADTTYAFRANNLSDLASAATARTNLGVTATGGDATYAFRSNNLSDLANAGTARTNLGLGTMATQNASAVAITGGSFSGATAFSASSNTTLRTIKGSLNVIINVKDYGALGDGATNDTAAIASAKTAAISAAGALYFPQGTYLTDTIAVASAAGLSIFGDGIGVSVIKARTPSQVLTIATSTRVSVHHLTFDGSCTTRTAGQQAVFFAASQSSFCDNEIINSGEFALFVGYTSAITDVIISRNLIRACYADGINIANVTRAIIANNMIDGSDDDCIAMGYHGVASFITVIGNYCRSRTDLGTTWGRGIAVLGASDVLIYGNYIENIKQYGILLDQNGTSVRPTRVQLSANTVKGVSINSGHAVALLRTTDCIFSDNVILNPTSGDCLELADWQNLTIQGGYFAQTINQFCRGIHADESAGWAASWDTLKISRVSINMNGASTNSCVYLNPHSSVTMNTIIIDGVVGQQVVAGDYITVGSARTGTLAKIVNNTTASAGKTVSPATGGVFTTVNNN